MHKFVSCVCLEIQTITGLVSKVETCPDRREGWAGWDRGGGRFKKGFVLAKEKRRGVIWRVKRRERGRGQVN